MNNYLQTISTSIFLARIGWRFFLKTFYSSVQVTKGFSVIVFVHNIKLVTKETKFDAYSLRTFSRLYQRKFFILSIRAAKESSTMLGSTKATQQHLKSLIIFYYIIRTTSLSKLCHHLWFWAENESTGWTK